MGPFTNDWCPGEEGILCAHFYRTKPVDCKDLLNGTKEMRPNTSHFGEDDYLYTYVIDSPPMSGQEMTFKFVQNASLEIDQYAFECGNQPLTAWKLEAALNPKKTTWVCIDRQQANIKPWVRYTFPILGKPRKYYGFRLTMTQPNSAGKWSICLHYFNFHGNYSPQ